LSPIPPTARVFIVESIGKLLVFAGLALAAVGLLIWLGPGRDRGSLLPGDIFVEKSNFKFYFPIVSCLLFSAVLTLLIWLFRK
jgi:hypothetical protein